MPENDPLPISQPIEEALLKLMRPDLLEQYQRERERHRQEKENIELLRKRARNFIWQRFRGAFRDQKLAEAEQEYVERSQLEDDVHAEKLHELRDTIRDHASPGWEEE